MKLICKKTEYFDVKVYKFHFFQGNSKFYYCRATLKLLKCKHLFLVVKICGFRKSQSTTSFFGGVEAAHGLMIVMH